MAKHARTDTHTETTIGPDGTRTEVVTGTSVVDITADAVRVDAHTRLRNILDRNRAYLDLPSPTAAQQRQQVERNTRAVNLIIRLLLALDDANARDLIDDDPGRE